MNFLSIDCSTNLGSLFVKVKNKSFSKILQSDKSNNDLLIKNILDFFKENNINLGDISHIFVNQGPGNFSGLRGSIATAKGISISNNLNLVGYNTFLLCSSKFFEKNEPIISFTKFREKYFFQKFTKKPEIISKIKEINKEELIKNYSNEFKTLPQNIAETVDKDILKLNNLNIVNLDHSQLEFLHLKGLLDKDLIKPLYLS